MKKNEKNASPTGRFSNFFENSTGTAAPCFAIISRSVSSVEPKDWKARVGHRPPSPS